MNGNGRKISPLAAALLAAGACAGGLGIAGCEKPPGPFVPKAAVPPKIVHCNDHTGHVPGSKPWVRGGTCCCTPSEPLMQLLHKDGFCTGMTADGLRREYEAKGIALRGPGHMFCSGLCERGPHVVLGGKCMCPPTPGTDYYERVVTGRGRVAARAGK